MIYKKLRAAFAITLLLCLTPPQLSAVAQTERAQAKARLVMVIVVDQFRCDYIERFWDLFGKGGFRRLVGEGAFFTNANFDYLPTYTAPGHAAVFSGSIPSQNGIVGNVWFDREAGRVRVMVSDNSARLLTGGGPVGDVGAPSPRSMIGTTIGDQMRLANNFQSKVVAISQKDRSAVLPGGHKPNGAYWFNAAKGEMVTSDYYFKELPGWVRQFNTATRPDKYFGAKWERTLSADAYKRAQSGNLPIQRSAVGQGFPYTVTGGEDKPGAKFYGAFEVTPFASEYLANFAKAAVEAESLGADQFTDLLSISFSAPDLAGHYYGPDSQEVLDTYIRLDRVIADLLTYLDRRVGPGNWVVAMTGDHGVSPVPEYLKSLGLEAHRIEREAVTNAVNRALKERFGDEKWVQALVGEQFYLDRKLISDKKVIASEVERVAGEAATTVEGVTAYFTRSQIVEGRLPSGPIPRRVMNGFHRARSGDVWIVTAPFTFLSEGSLATTHGSPYNYDTHVPVVFYGRGVRAGRYYSECSPSDIATTLAAMLGVEPPSNAVGRVLSEALVDAARQSASR
jgi:predicted AlkP superfamily pyrophosphatase or phosphodiesterase